MLQSLEIKNFTVFEEAKLEFSAGLNVVIGENGTGKSQLLKLGYVFLRIEHENPDMITRIQNMGAAFFTTFMEVYQPESLAHLVSHQQEKSTVKATFLEGTALSFGFSSQEKTIAPEFEFETEGVHFPKPLFIPTREIMSVYAGFAGALRNRELAFDGTFLDLADALALTPLKGERAELVHPIIEVLEKQMRGKVIVKNGRFYLEQGKKRLEMPLVAEGIRKIAMLAYLIMNGSIQKGSTVFWDEPESNLNPKMMVQLAETLVTLSSMGIQIVLATHSLFLLRELKIQLLKHPEAPARYFALKPEKQGVSVHQGDSMEELDPITALDADLEQSERYLELE